MKFDDLLKAIINFAKLITKRNMILKENQKKDNKVNDHNIEVGSHD